MLRFVHLVAWFQMTVLNSVLELSPAWFLGLLFSGAITSAVAYGFFTSTQKKTALAWIYFLLISINLLLLIPLAYVSYCVWAYKNDLWHAASYYFYILVLSVLLPAVIAGFFFNNQVSRDKSNESTNVC